MTLVALTLVNAVCGPQPAIGIGRVFGMRSVARSSRADVDGIKARSSVRAKEQPGYLTARFTAESISDGWCSSSGGANFAIVMDVGFIGPIMPVFMLN
jgi:hypothetical protein